MALHRDGVGHLLVFESLYKAIHFVHNEHIDRRTIEQLELIINLIVFCPLGQYFPREAMGLFDLIKQGSITL